MEEKTDIDALKERLKTLESHYDFKIIFDETEGLLRKMQSLNILYSKFYLISWSFQSEIHNDTFNIEKNSLPFRRGSQRTHFLDSKKKSELINVWSTIQPKLNGSNMHKSIANNVLDFFDSIQDQTKKNELINVFCYQSFPALFYYFTIGDFIPLAYDMIEIVFKKIDQNETHKLIFGKMCSVFFAGFSQISSVFSESFWRIVKSNIYEKYNICEMIEKAIAEIPSGITKFHTKIIRLMKDYPVLFIQYIIKDVFIQNLITIILNDITLIFKDGIDEMKIRTACNDFIQEISDLTNHKAENIINNILTDNGTEVFLPFTTETHINISSHYITFREINLLINICNFHNRIPSLHQLDIMQHANANINEKDREIYENLIFEFTVSFPKEDEYKHKNDCQDIDILEMFELLDENNLHYYHLFDDEKDQNYPDEILQLAKTIRSKGKELKLIQERIKYFEWKKENFDKNIYKKYNLQLFYRFSQDFKEYAKVHLYRIGIILSNKYTFLNDKPTYSSQTKNHSKSFLKIIMPYIVLNLAAKISDSQEYINIIKKSGSIQEIHNFIQSYNSITQIGIISEENAILKEYIYNSILYFNKCKKRTFMERYLAIINIIKQMVEVVLLSGIKEVVEIRKTVLSAFFQTYFLANQDFIFETYAQYSKLLVYESEQAKNSVFSDALSSDEPNYKDLMSYLDEGFQNEIFPSCPKAEAAFQTFLNTPLNNF